MKNFTKQNFKTNPLWIRLLIMTFMLLAGAGNAWGATRTFSSGDYIYIKNFKPNGWGDYWFTSTQKYGWAHMWGGTAGDNDYSFELYSGTAGSSGAIYRAKITKAGTYTKIIFTRNTSNNGVWNDKTNQTGDLDLPSTGNRLTALNNGGDSPYNPVWDTYNPCNTTSLTWNNDSSIKTSMKKGDTQTVSVTLSPSGAGTPTFTTSSSSVISLSGSGSSCTLTAEAAGSATITASFAEANGYCGSSIIKTITVTDPCSPKYYIAGTLPGASWDASKHLEMTCVDGLRSYTFTDAGKGEYKFKITNNTWGSQWNTLNTSKSSGVTCKSNDTDGNMVFETPAEGNITIYFDDALKAWVTWEANCSTPKTPSIESSHSSICSGDNTEVTITVTGDAETYALYVVNNGYTKQSNEAVNNTFTVSPTKTTTYVVKAFNGACASDNYSNDVTVEVSEKPSITLNPTSTAICKGDQLDLSKFASSTVNLTWWNGQTQITEPVSPETNTTYTVKAVNGACTVTKDFPVTVNALPSAPGLGNSASSQCVTANGTVNLNTLASPVGTVNWYDSSSQLISNATVSIANAGIFTYTAKAVSKGCESSSGTPFELTVKYNANASNYSIKDAFASKVYTGGELGLTTDEIEVYNNAGAVVSVYFKQDGNIVDPINVGDYEVYVTTAATDDICAGDIKIGTFTITQATQDELSITNEQVKYCGLPSEAITLTATGGSTNETVKYVSDDETVATISGSELTVLKEGSVTITATRPGGTNYNDITATKQFTFYKAPEKPTASQVVNIQQCKNGFTNGKIVINNVEPGNELDKYEYTINPAATGNAKDGFVISNRGDYVVKVTRTVDGCTMQTNSDLITVETDNNTPDATVSISGEVSFCEGGNTTLTCNTADVKGQITAYQWYNGRTIIQGETNQTYTASAAGNYKVEVTVINNGCEKTFSATKEVAMKNKPSTPVFNPNSASICAGGKYTLADGYTWYVDLDGEALNNLEVSPISNTTYYAIKEENGCSSNAGTFTVNVNALPIITLTADNANVNVGETVTLTATGNNFTSLDWSYTGGDFTLGTNNTATLTSAEDANITVTVTATSNDGCTATATIQVIFGSEDCEAESSANYIEVLCRTTGGTRDMYCYAWTGSSTEKLGAWPGQKTNDGDYTYNGTKYAYWKIEGDAINIIFNNGSGTKTGDITGLEKGKRYVFTISTNYQTVTKTVDGETIYMPEVETTSITPTRDGNTTNVTLVGRVKKKGCAEIVWYGFQYSTDGGESFTDFGAVQNTDLELGEIFTHTQAFDLGTYMFRAKIINKNGSKVYGEKVRVTVAERDLAINAIHNDTSVDTDTYYDFVGLYMSSISKPTNAEILSYTWYKDGNEYNPTFTASNLYGETYINTNGTNNIRPNQTGTYKLVVALSNGATLESNEITINKGSKVSASSILDASNRTLPVISVRTNEDFPACKSESFPSAQASNLKKKRSVDVKIFDKDGNLYYDRKARMNYRGSSSLNFVKKSYAFCPGDEMCGDVEKGLDYVITKKVNMFNLGAKDKDWVLYAAAADPSMMRNRIVYNTYAKMTGEWGVKSMYVELVVDGEYKGVYVFMDKITNNKDRVNITNAAGFIVKFDKTDEEDRYVNGQDEDSDEKTFRTTRTGEDHIFTYDTYIDQRFEIEYPEKKDNKANWSNIVTSIQKRFENFETALAKGDYATVRNIIDYTSWADWFILNEYIKNQDAYRASCIFVYNGEKIEARPVWDQELSMNNTCRTSHGCDNTETLLITTASIYADTEDFPAPFWFTGGNQNITGGLLKDGCFVSLVQQRWSEHLAAGMPLNSETLTALLNKFDGELTKDNGTSDLNTAQKREAKYWDGKTRSTASCGNGGTGYGNTSYDTEKGNISGWINGDRTEKLGTILNNMTGELSGGISITMNPANGTVTPWIPVKVTVNVDEGTKYTYDDKSITTGITEDTDKAIVSSQGNVYTYTFPRPEAWGTGNDNGNTKDTRSYIINAALVDQSTECPGLSTDAVVQVKLADEGDDNCTE